jgi:hypothetical protein
MACSSGASGQVIANAHAELEAFQSAAGKQILYSGNVVAGPSAYNTMSW